MAGKVIYQNLTNQKEEKKMVITDFKEWNSMDAIIVRAYELAKARGCSNPFDKYKFREHQVGDILGHDVFEGASNGGSNDDTFGADAHEQDGSKAEYKSITMDDKELDKLLGNNPRGTTLKASGVYNGAYSQESIDRYRECNHYFSLHSDGEVVGIVKVDTDYVCDTLQENNEKREEKTKLLISEGVSKLPTTNCNSVKVEVIDSNPLIEFVYKNTKYFG
jgi:hypothetical protein